MVPPRSYAQLRNIATTHTHDSVHGRSHGFCEVRSPHLLLLCRLFHVRFTKDIALLRACVEKRGRTTGVLNQRADDGRGKEKDLRTYEQRNTGTWLVIAEDTNGRRDRETRMYVCISKNDERINRARERLQPIRPANRCRCLIVYARKGIQWRCCRKHTGVP